MKVLKLVAAVLLCLLPVWIVIWYSHCRLLHFSDKEVAYQVWDREIVRNEEALKRYDVLILGDSVANAGYVPEYLSYNTLNLAVSATGPVISYYILLHFIENGGHPKTVFITYTDGHLNTTTSTVVLYDKVFRSHLLRPEEEYELLSTAASLNDKSIIKPNYRMEWISCLLGLPNVAMPSILKEGLEGRTESNRNEIARIDMHRGSYLSWTTREFSQYDDKAWNTFDITPMSVMYINKILSLCREKGIAVKIVYHPLHPCVTEQPDLKKKDAYFAALAEKYDNVEIVRSYMHGFGGDDFSVDTHHLNLKGALKFSRMIRERYPDIFSSQHHDEKDLQAMEEYLCMDDKLDSLVYRLEPPFAGVIFKRSGIAYAPEKHVWNNLPVEHVSPSTSLINGKGIIVIEKGTGIEVRFGDKKNDVRDLGIGNQADLFLLVINMQTHRVVTEKRFVDKKSSFALVQ